MNTALNRTTQLLLTNKSGGSVAQGDVVVVDTANASSFTTTTTSGYVSGTPGVVLEPGGIANNATGMVAICGYVPVINLSGTGSIGDLVKCHTVAKQGVRHAAPSVAGDFAQVFGTTATPTAILWGNVNFGGGSGTIGGSSGATDNAIIRADGTGGSTVQSSLATVDDSGGVNIPTGQTYNINGSPHTHSSVSNDNYTITSGSQVLGPIFPLTAPSLGSFTAVNQGSATATTEGNGISVYDPTVDSSVNYRIWKKSYTAAKAVKVLILPNILRINYQHFGIGFFDDSNSGHVLRIIPGDSELRSTKISSPTADSANYTLDVGGPPAALFGPYMWLGIEDDNTNRHVSFSTDGQHFVKLHSVSRTDFLTPTGWGFFINSRSNKTCRITILSWTESTSLTYT